jgi:hypothetical protein
VQGEAAALGALGTSGPIRCYDPFNFLHGRGFVLVGIFNTTYALTGLAVQGDFLFRRHPPHRENEPRGQS